jgi:serine protease AprX
MSWAQAPRTARVVNGLLALAVAGALAVSVSPAPASATPGGWRELVVQGPGALDALGRAGARVKTELGVIDGWLARVPAARVAGLTSDPGVSSVVAADRPLQVLGRHTADTGDTGAYDSPAAAGAAARTGADKVWPGADGDGIAVAVVDTGISSGADLDSRVVAAADLTGEQTFADSYGHGTFMAGLIAGDGGRSGPTGVAPDADLVDLKVADRNGDTSLGQVLYALQLADSARKRFNIKVLNLSLGVPADDPATAPLTEAIERLWADGVTVVTAAGNDGTMTAPGIDPYAITVGALDQGASTSAADDSVPSWSGTGRDYAGRAKPDVLAPGVGTVSVRAPGSAIDEAYPSARRGDRWFSGSGTSMSTAIVSGAAALIAAAHPGWGPDEIKGALVGTSRPVAGQRAGALDLRAAVGLGRARSANGDLLSLEVPGQADAPTDPGADVTSLGWRESDDFEGRRWMARGWSAGDWADADWDARQWAARQWAARQWAARQWAARQWAARQWAARQWARTGLGAENWAALQWTWIDAAESSQDIPQGDLAMPDWMARQWAARQWAGRQWAGRQWAGRQWAGRQWAGRQWSARQWAVEPESRGSLGAGHE